MSTKEVLAQLAQLRTQIDGLRTLSTTSQEVVVKLRQEALLFRQVVHGSPVCFLAIDGGGVVRVANDTFLQLVGKKREDVIGCRFLDVFDRPDDCVMIQRITGSGAQNRSLVHTHRIVDDRGISRWIEWHGRPVFSESGVYEYYFAIGIDVTARERASSALAESERKLSTLLRNLPGMAYRCANNPNWTMEFVSEGALALTGYSAADLVGDARIPFGELIHADDRERVWCDIQSALEARRSFQLNYRIHTATGQLKWVWEQGQGVLDASGELVALEGFITDVTEWRSHAGTS